MFFVNDLNEGAKRYMKQQPWGTPQGKRKMKQIFVVSGDHIPVDRLMIITSINLFSVWMHLFTGFGGCLLLASEPFVPLSFGVV